MVSNLKILFENVSYLKSILASLENYGIEFGYHIMVHALFTMIFTIKTENLNQLRRFPGQATMMH